MKDFPRKFPVVTHQDETLSHNLEVDYLLYDLFFSSTIEPIWGGDEELRLSREVIYIFEF